MSSPPGMVVYHDASALVKRYVTEAGSSWITALGSSSSNNILATARVTKAEAAAAFASKYRSGNLSQTNYTKALQDLAHDFIHEYVLVEVDQALVDLAADLTTRQKLRGYDAVQLAAALIMSSTLTQAQLSPPLFVAADDDLLKAAQSEGLSTDNPNWHP